MGLCVIFVQSPRLMRPLRHGFWMRKVRVVEARVCSGNGGFGLRNAGVFATGKAGKAGALRLVFRLEMKSLCRWAGVSGDEGFGRGGEGILRFCLHFSLDLGCRGFLRFG